MSFISLFPSMHLYKLTLNSRISANRNKVGEVLAKAYGEILIKRIVSLL